MYSLPNTSFVHGFNIIWAFNDMWRKYACKNKNFIDNKMAW